jgi:hypothetical protein
MTGFILTRQVAAGKWGASTYALEKSDRPEGHKGHRDHRSHIEAEPTHQRSDAPYDPYASGDPTESPTPESPQGGLSGDSSEDDCFGTPDSLWQ